MREQGMTSSLVYAPSLTPTQQVMRAHEGPHGAFYSTYSSPVHSCMRGNETCAKSAVNPVGCNMTREIFCNQLAIWRRHTPCLARLDVLLDVLLSIELEAAIHEPSAAIH
jgi:hypothetical protein